MRIVKRREDTVLVTDMELRRDWGALVLRSIASNISSLTSRRTDKIPTRIGSGNYLGLVEMPELMFSSYSSSYSSPFRPSRTILVHTENRANHGYNHNAAAAICNLSQRFSIEYPVMTTGQTVRGVRTEALRYRLFVIGNGSFIDTTEETLASAYRPSRLTIDWKPDFKRALHSFMINTGKEHINKALFLSLFDPTRYKRKTSSTCKKLMEDFGELLWKAVKDKWIPEVDYIFDPSGTSINHSPFDMNDLAEKLADKDKKQYIRMLENDDVKRENMLKCFKEVSKEGRASRRSAGSLEDFCGSTGTLIPKLCFSVVRIGGGILGSSNALCNEFQEHYASSDINFMRGSEKARTKVGSYHYIGYICPDTNAFNYADNVYCAFMLNSIIESTCFLNKYICNMSSAADINPITVFQFIGDVRSNPKKYMPSYLANIYRKSMNLEYKWHIERMKISTWRSPYCVERGYR